MKKNKRDIFFNNNIKGLMDNFLERSYKGYIRQQKIGYLTVNCLEKNILAFLFILFFLPLSIFSIFSKKKVVNNHILFIFSFSDKEPMNTILKELDGSKSNRIIKYPKALPFLPQILLKDFLSILCKEPIWTIKNLDFFGALSVKISKYYGYKKKYSISKLLLFQEYSFYSSYLTRIFEYENGGLYNLMHGVPGREASYFRFTKCFVWSEYFKEYYIENSAEENQFIIAGSIFHSKLYNSIKNTSTSIKYDILYAMQGDTHGDDNYVKEVFEVLEELYRTEKVRIAVKPHPIYSNKIDIPKNFDLLDSSPVEAILESNLILSHFSTMLLDAKVVNKKVLAFLPEEKLHLVGYLNENEVVFDKQNLLNKIIFLLSKESNYLSDIVDPELNTVDIIERELLK